MKLLFLLKLVDYKNDFENEINMPKYTSQLKLPNKGN